MRILIVEDNILSADLFQITLESVGHKVVVERNGRAGRDRALTEQFDLMLLDIQLPAMDGTAVCRELRASGVTTPILALTASAMPNEVMGGKAAGFDEYLTKPISPKALRDAVLRHNTDPVQAV